MIIFPPIAEQLIEERVKNLLGLKKEEVLSVKEYKKLALNVKTLSDFFTKKQEERPDYYLNNKLLMAAYMGYFVPSNLMKIEKPLSELFQHGDIITGDEISFLDLGSGPGTASAGFIHFLFEKILPERELKGLSITAADRVKENLGEAQSFLGDLFQRYQSSRSHREHISFKLNTAKMDLHHLQKTSLGGKRYDVVVMSNSLVETEGGEAGIEERYAMIEFIAGQYMKRDGSLIIIEPALRDSSRDLLMLRDEIGRRGKLNVYSPCLDSGPCQALVNKKDWCHEGYSWQPPAIVKEIDKRTAFEKTSLKFSYLVLRQDGFSINDLFCDKEDETLRVVSDLMSTKGEKRVFVCGKRGRVQLGRLNRDKSEANADFDNIKRGDVISVEGLNIKGTLLRVGPESRLNLLPFKE